MGQCLPAKKTGGLGVLDLRKQNKALLTKNLHKFFNQHDIPWVQLIWSTYYNDGQVPSFPTEVGISGGEIVVQFSMILN